MIRIIVAMSVGRVIGKDNKLIWKQASDLKRFKELTTGYPCIMGRKTYESIGRPLPNRKNCIVSRTITELEGCHVYHSISKAIEDNPDCYIIGGEEIYRQTIDISDEIHMTFINCEVDGDAFFPEFDNYECVWDDQHEKDETNQYNYKFLKYVRTTRTE
jgi:dihydrofolate reductase